MKKQGRALALMLAFILAAQAAACAGGENAPAESTQAGSSAEESAAGAGEAGFLTACYIVLVPIIGLFIGRKCSFWVWPAVGIALVGLYLLCNPFSGGSFSISTADLALLMCALLFSVQILCVDHYAPIMSPVALACVQFFVSGAVSLVAAFIFEFIPDPSAWISSLSAPSSWIAILYTGIFSCGVGSGFSSSALCAVSPSSSSAGGMKSSIASTITGSEGMKDCICERS